MADAADKFAERQLRRMIALEKASLPGMGALPAGTSTATLEQIAASTQANVAVDTSAMLPRVDPMVPFGPGMPIRPTSIDPREPGSDRPTPRVSDFDVGWNLRLIDDAHTPFPILREVAEVDVIRKCIEVRKSELCSLDWGVTISERTVKQIMASSGEKRPGVAMQMAREKYADDIALAEAFWQTPDRLNGLDFVDWLGMLIEDWLVLDAMTIYPHPARDGSLHSFEVVDGSTIKPLRDHRGAVPQPPAPAYQQILKGFVRGEFIASTGELVHRSFFRDRLVYRPMLRRSHTPYGLSAVDTAIAVADLWLKRMEWMRTEFTAGTMPDGFVTTDTPMDPNQLSAYEQAFNDFLSGNTVGRKGLKVLPKGFDINELVAFTDKYNPAFDELLVKLLCACLDVMPTEVGFPPSSGIGGKGHQEGEESTTYRRAIRPSVVRLQALMTHLQRVYLGTPAELEFSWTGYEIEDQAQVAEQSKTELQSGQRTLNEDRAAKGQPLYEFPEADVPWVMTGAGIQFLPGALDHAEAMADAAVEAAAAPPMLPPAPDDSADDSEGKPAADSEQAGEVGKFLRYVRKRAGGSWRDFDFEHVDEVTAARLNALGKAGDVDGIRSLGKGRAPRRGTLTTAKRSALVARWAPRLRDAMADVLASPEAIADGWATHLAATKSTTAEARGYIAQHTGDPGPLTGELVDLYEEAFEAGALGAADIAELDLDLDDLEDEDTGNGSRLAMLKRGARDIALAIIAIKVTSIAKALVSNAESNRAGAIAALLDEPPDTATTAEVDKGAVTGAAAAYSQGGIEYVRLVAETDCEFCADYDGRILGPDDTGGLPPLHPFCSCDIEPVTPEEQQP